LQKQVFFKRGIMDAEPETLSLWSKMVAALKSHISYGPCVKQVVSDINVTEIFIKRDGDRDEDAITFWSQLIATPGVKNEVETMLSHSLKRGKDRGVMVQRIPLSRNTKITKEFIAYVTSKIRNTQSLWNVGAIGLTKSKPPTVSEIELTETVSEFPITPGPSEVTKVMEQHISDTRRSYHRRQMKPGNVYDMSATSQRRIIKQVEETIIGI
jgi:hypothetical protein